MLSEFRGKPRAGSRNRWFLECHHVLSWMCESHMIYNTKHLSEQLQNASFKYIILSSTWLRDIDHYRRLVFVYPGCVKVIWITRPNSFLWATPAHTSFQYMIILSPAWFLRRDCFGRGFVKSMMLRNLSYPFSRQEEFLFSISEAPEVQSFMAKLEKSLTANLFFQVRTAFHHTLVCRFWEKSMPFAARVYQKCMEHESKFLQFPGIRQPHSHTELEHQTSFWATPECFLQVH